jgi:DNA-binding CsgD family transcriptional regulator
VDDGGSTAAASRRCKNDLFAGGLFGSGDFVVYLLKAEGLTVPFAAVHSTLTPREREIFEAVLRLETTREIAASRGLRYQTVKNYLTTIYDKLGVANRLELCAEYREAAVAPRGSLGPGRIPTG